MNDEALAALCPVSRETIRRYRIQFAQCAISNLSTVNLRFNDLIRLRLPRGLTRLTELCLEGNQLTSLKLPEELSSLSELRVGNNQLTDVSLLEGLSSLTMLRLDFNNLTTATIRSCERRTHLRLQSQKLHDAVREVLDTIYQMFCA